jgi:Na+-driven multidrug efflux pump
MPVIINEIAWSVGITTYNGIFARVGTGAIAAFNVTSTVNQLAMVFFMGTANAAAVMIGSRIGAGELGVARSWAKRFAILSPLYGLVMSALMAPSALLLPLLFAMDPEPLRQASIMILVMAGVFPFKIFNLHVIVGICRSGGDTRFGAFFDIFGIWGIGVPLALLGAFVLKLQPWQVFLLLNLEEPIKAMLGAWRIITGKWLNDVTA